MSNCLAPSALTAWLSCFCITALTQAPSPSLERNAVDCWTQACQPGWTVARTLLFTGSSRRAQASADGAWWLAKALLQAGVHRGDGGLVEGVRPLPLPATVAVQKPLAPPDVAALQRTYRRLVGLGLYEEAAEVAKRIAAPDPNTTEGTQVIPAVAIDQNPSRTPITSPSFVRESSPTWASNGKRPISLRLEGASLEEAARSISGETGAVIDVHRGFGPSPRVYFSCKSLPADQALEKIAESCGLVVQPTAEGAALAPPLAIPLRDARLPILR